MTIGSLARRALDVVSRVKYFDRWRLQLAAARSNEPELELLSNLVPGRPFIDVGANVGLYTWRALAAGASSVVAFEPNPRLAERLERVGRGDVVVR